MPWENSFDVAEGIVCTRAYGVVTLLDYHGCARETYVCAQENSSKLLLINLLEVTSILTLSDLLNIPPVYLKLGFDETYRAAFCVVGDKERRETYSFYEKLCLNQGFNIRIFHNEEDARIWLSCG